MHFIIITGISKMSQVRSC